MSGKPLRFLCLYLVLTLSVAARSLAGGITESYNWIAGTDVADTTINYMIMTKFAELIKERSGGKINVEIYFGGQLGNTSEVTQGVVTGTIQIGSGMTGGLIDFVPQNAIFDLPNLFPNVDVLRKTLAGDFLQTINEFNREGGLTMLCYADAGFRQLSSNKVVRSLKDLAGQKIRVMPNPYHVAYWTALGANPVAMDFSEVFMGLQQGTIDGQENPYMNIVANNMHEAQKYIIETNHLGHTITFFMNDDLYQSLPNDVRALVDECAAEARAYANSKADQSIRAYKETCVKAGCEIIILSPEVLKEFQDKAGVVYDMARKNVGDDLIDGILARVAEASK
ncbi:MAG: TRAP transporter substrate-binding protein [Planctomycetota bacterium]|jgi:tripartite ATP-independent transporter DctP family solute receptor|nr:TRAP transporter substrate-binding protein [Planctomycetota bacterium]